MIISIIIIENHSNKLDTSKLNEKDIINKQNNVTSIIKKYVDNIPTLSNYAKDNSATKVTLKELKEVFGVNIDEVLNNKCSEDTFIKYNDDYSNCVIVLGCADFYIN